MAPYVQRHLDFNSLVEIFFLSTSHPTGQDLNVHILESGGVTWVNIERPSDAELSWVEEHYGIHPMALQEGPGHGELSTIDDFDTYLAIDMFFPVFDCGTVLLE